MGYFFHFWVKIHSKLNWKFRIKILVCILFQMSDFYLMYNLMCQFVSAQMAVLSTIFQVFIVLVMYNFVHCCLLGRHWKERGSEKKKKRFLAAFVPVVLWVTMIMKFHEDVTLLRPWVYIWQLMIMTCCTRLQWPLMLQDPLLSDFALVPVFIPGKKTKGQNMLRIFETS